MSEGDDYASVLQAFSAYSIGLDRHRWGLLASAFTGDGIWEHADGTRYVGLQAIIDAQAERQPNRPTHTLHRPGNILVSFKGDTAHADSDWLYYGSRQGSPWTLLSCGYYDDDLVRTPDGWRIKHRKIVRAPEE